jgi:hypothetical protein
MSGKELETKGWPATATNDVKPVPALTTTAIESGLILILDSDSAKAWRVMDYEVSMHRDTQAHIQDFPIRSWQRNAVVESHLLHIRNLCEVFDEKKGRRRDDVLPSHLFREWNAAPEYAEARQRLTICWPRMATRITQTTRAMH